MPHVTVIFDPTKISQDVIDELKAWLQNEVSLVLSLPDCTSDPEAAYDNENVIAVSPREIMVMQRAAHPTDVNVPPLEIYIEAGRSKGRDPVKVVMLLAERINESGLVPDEFLGEDQAGIFVVFHEHNAFGFIPNT